MHLVSDPALQPTSAGEHVMAHHPSGAHGAAAPEERPASHHADAEYFAVLLGTFLGGVTLWLLLRNDRRRERPFSTWRLAGSSSATVFNLPRGPTLPYLQVLRL
jgi:hypothetical protein